MTRKHQLHMIVIAAVAVGLGAGLTGCSTADGPVKSEKTPSATPSIPSNLPTSFPSATWTTPADVEQVDAACIDGSAIIENANNKSVTVPDCASVTVNSSNVAVHLGAVEDLRVNGAINGINAKSVGSVTFKGDGNQLTTDGKPEVHDKGKKNKVQPTE